MYDLVSGEYYRNSSTGDFAYGNTASGAFGRVFVKRSGAWVRVDVPDEIVNALIN
jgi:hypothetical protein